MQQQPLRGAREHDAAWLRLAGGAVALQRFVVAAGAQLDLGQDAFGFERGKTARAAGGVQQRQCTLDAVTRGGRVAGIDQQPRALVQQARQVHSQRRLALDGGLDEVEQRLRACNVALGNQAADEHLLRQQRGRRVGAEIRLEHRRRAGHQRATAFAFAHRMQHTAVSQFGLRDHHRVVGVGLARAANAFAQFGFGLAQLAAQLQQLAQVGARGSRRQAVGTRDLQREVEAAAVRSLGRDVVTQADVRKAEACVDPLGLRRVPRPARAAVEQRHRALRMAQRQRSVVRQV